MEHGETIRQNEVHYELQSVGCTIDMSHNQSKIEGKFNTMMVPRKIFKHYPNGLKVCTHSFR